MVQSGTKFIYNFSYKIDFDFKVLQSFQKSGRAVKSLENKIFWHPQEANFFTEPVFPTDCCHLHVNFRLFVGVTTPEIQNGA